MRAGNFFKVDENSKIHDGTVIFRYLRISAKGASKQGIEYPVYMTIDSHSINFYFHGIKQPESS